MTTTEATLLNLLLFVLDVLINVLIAEFGPLVGLIGGAFIAGGAAGALITHRLHKRAPP